MPQAVVRLPPVGLERDEDLPVAVALGQVRLGRREPEHPRPPDHVPLPPAPRDRPAPSEQEPVARLDALADLERGRRAHRAERQRRLAAAVDHLEQQAALAARRVGGPEDHEVGLEPDSPGRVGRGQAQVRDRRVGGRGGIDGEARDPVQPLVRAGGPERAA
ncbi:MAG: hypothetical protein E6J41_21855 [Chloroflexi bacterium]|nr:MAG: hypothetical protein E6J41_21855 [Chloroflexota bacterium]